MKKILAAALVLVLALSLAACGGEPQSSSAADGSSQVSASSGLPDAEGGKTAAEMKIGIVQLSEHPALDAACKGFVDTLVAAGFSAENIEIQNAQGEQSNCAPIVNKFVNDKVDLILAIATPAAQAAAQATKDIPILVTAVTDPADAGLVASNEKPGGNVSGTSDMNPIDDQVALLQKLVPTAQTVGVLYCSSEANSKLQADLAVASMESAGLTTKVYTVAETSEINAVVTKITQECDALYIPTDNLFASNMAAVTQVAIPAKLPVICGESGMVDQGGLATYGLNYENLGKMTGQQAIDILLNGAAVADMPIGYSAEADLTLAINQETADAIGVVIPDDLK
ncbi:MAG: ABC transporter substrate-binding protein [Oscillospiraceae bacterium]|nr:ABC transporter substrate-binding protein [Oscillospiraceae bacterium]